MKDTNQEARKMNELKEEAREVQIVVRIPVKTYRRLLAKARDAGVETSTFIDNLINRNLLEVL